MLPAFLWSKGVRSASGLQQTPGWADWGLYGGVLISHLSQTGPGAAQGTVASAGLSSAGAAGRRVPCTPLDGAERASVYDCRGRVASLPIRMGVWPPLQGSRTPP